MIILYNFAFQNDQYKLELQYNMIQKIIFQLCYIYYIKRVN